MPILQDYYEQLNEQYADYFTEDGKPFSNFLAKTLRIKKLKLSHEHNPNCLALYYNARAQQYYGYFITNGLEAIDNGLAMDLLGIL